MAITQITQTETFDIWRTKINEVFSDIGDTAVLGTSEISSTNIIDAILALKNDLVQATIGNFKILNGFSSALQGVFNVSGGGTTDLPIFCVAPAASGTAQPANTATDTFYFTESQLPYYTDLTLGSATVPWSSIFATTLGSVGAPIATIYATTIVASFKLANNAYFQARNFANDGDVNLFKLNTSNEFEVESFFLTASGVKKWALANDIIPSVDITNDLGSASYRLRNSYIQTIYGDNLFGFTTASELKLGYNASGPTVKMKGSAYSGNNSGGITYTSDSTASAAHLFDIESTTGFLQFRNVSSSAKIGWLGTSLEYVFEQNHNIRSSRNDTIFTLAGGSTISDSDSGPYVKLFAKDNGTLSQQGQILFGAKWYQINVWNSTTSLKERTWDISEKSILPYTDNTNSLGSTIKRLKEVWGYDATFANLTSTNCWLTSLTVSGTSSLGAISAATANITTATVTTANITNLSPTSPISAPTLTPAGTIITYAGRITNAETENELFNGWLYCNGKRHLASTYPNLATAIGTGTNCLYKNHPYKNSSGVQDNTVLSDSNYFKVPCLDNCYIKSPSWGAGAGWVSIDGQFPYVNGSAIIPRHYHNTNTLIGSSTTSSGGSHTVTPTFKTWDNVGGYSGYAQAVSPSGLGTHWRTSCTQYAWGTMGGAPTLDHITDFRRWHRHVVNGGAHTHDVTRNLGQSALGTVIQTIKTWVNGEPQATTSSTAHTHDCWDADFTYDISMEQSLRHYHLLPDLSTISVAAHTHTTSFTSGTITGNVGYASGWNADAATTTVSVTGTDPTHMKVYYLIRCR